MFCADFPPLDAKMRGLENDGEHDDEHEDGEENGK